MLGCHRPAGQPPAVMSFSDGKAMGNGRVYLVGAGPGDPGLLTVEATRLLQTADVVFHDDLVSPEILEMIPERVHVENVGKRCGQASITQDQIHSLLINAAREGWKVVRLKSGDPLVYGRAGEELDALRRAGIACEVVPGITAAFGAAARAGITLTDRRLASKLVFLSNHECAGKYSLDEEGARAQDSTVVVYMPGTDCERLAVRLCAEGLDPDTPCLVVSCATTPRQEVHFTRLAALTEGPGWSTPAVLIVGAVAARYSQSMPDNLEATAGQPFLLDFQLSS